MATTVCRRQPRVSRQFGGYTLTELLVVVAVISFLLALLVPAIQASREAARRSHCNNNLKQIGLGLQSYADINKSFPPDGLWGQYPISRFGVSSGTKQSAYHYPWTVSILSLIEANGRLYDAINKRTALWNQSQQYGIGYPSKISPPAYFGYIQSLQIPPYRCPDDHTFTGPGDMPGSCMWTNYAGSVGVGFYSAALSEDSNCEAETTAPVGTRGLFAFNEPARFGIIKDGTSNTIAVAEVSACGVAAPNVRSASNFNSTLAQDLAFAADLKQPQPPLWNLPSETSSWSLAPLLAGGSGKHRSKLFAKLGGSVHVPMVFRSSMVAFTESITGSGACSLPNTYSSAQGGNCGVGAGPNAVIGFEMAGKVGQTPIVGMAPLYNALYSPNSNWPGPDSFHPNVVLVVFADGHTNAIQNNIQFAIWASLNTRNGGEPMYGDF